MESILPFCAGAVAALVLRGAVVSSFQSLRFFLSQFEAFSADGTYNDANLDGVLRRNADVPSLWMNLGYSEAVTRHNHHPLSRFKGERTLLNAAAGDVGVFTTTALGGGAGSQRSTKQHRDQ